MQFQPHSPYDDSSIVYKFKILISNVNILLFFENTYRYHFRRNINVNNKHQVDQTCALTSQLFDSFFLTRSKSKCKNIKVIKGTVRWKVESWLVTLSKLQIKAPEKEKKTLKISLNIFKIFV